LLDPTTGAPLGEPRPLALNNVSPSRLWLSGPPGRLVWAHIDYSADAGFRSWLGGLNDDGSPKNDERDITALGSLNALVSTPSHHWASFQLRGADGGTVSVLHRFDGDGGDETVAQFDGPTAALALADTGVVRVGVTATGVQAAFLSQTGQPLGEVPFARSCSSLVAAGRGEELWVGCAEVNTPLEWSSTLSLTRGSPPAQES
jgi:hypothetical protein